MCFHVFAMDCTAQHGKADKVLSINKIPSLARKSDLLAITSDTPVNDPQYVVFHAQTAKIAQKTFKLALNIHNCNFIMPRAIDGLNESISH